MLLRLKLPHPALHFENSQKVSRNRIFDKNQLMSFNIRPICCIIFKTKIIPDTNEILNSSVPLQAAIRPDSWYGKKLHIWIGFFPWDFLHLPLTPVMPISGVWQSGRLVVFRSSYLWDDSWPSTLLCRKAHRYVWKNCSRKGGLNLHLISEVIGWKKRPSQKTETDRK